MSDVGQRRDNVRARRQQLRLPPVVHLSGDIVRHHQFGGPVEVKLSQHELGFGLVDAGNLGAQQGDLVVDGLHGVLQRPAPAHGLRFDAAHFGLGDLQVRRRRIDSRLFDRDCDLKRLLVEFDQQVSLAHPVVVVDEDARDLAPDAGGDECHVTVHIGVVGRNRVERRLDPGNAEPKGGRRESPRPAAPRSILRRPAGFFSAGSVAAPVGSCGIGAELALRFEVSPLLCSLMAHPVIEQMNDNPARP